MKGSTYHRRVHNRSYDEFTEESKIDDTLKDEDFIEIEKELDLQYHDHIRIVNQISRDVEFFHSKKIIDYSMIVFVIDTRKFTDPAQLPEFLQNYRVFQERDPAKGRFAYIFGIIDFFQLYNFGKAFERCAKRTIKCNAKLETSTQPPDKYADRYVKFTKRILVCNDP